MILSTIWPAPRAATVGKISALVIVKPQATQNTLKKNVVNGHKSGKTPREFFQNFETYRRMRGRHDIQIRAPTDGIIHS